MWTHPRSALHGPGSPAQGERPISTAAPFATMAMIGLLLGAADAGAQEGPPSGSPDPELETLEPTAGEADSAAAAAREVLERMRGRSQPAPSPEAPAEPPTAAAPASGPPAAEESPPRSTEEDAREQLERATEAAREAAREAREAAREARAVANAARNAAKQARARFARTGPLVGVGAFYALEDFDSTSGLDLDDSFGGAAWVGYRVHPRIALELRGEVLEGFDIEPDAPAEAGVRQAELDGFLVTAGPKLYPFTGSIQPFVGLGFGAMRGVLEGEREDGSRFGDRATAGVFRPAAGIDLFLSELLVLNVEAAYVLPSGSLGELDFGVLSTGLTYRF